MRLGDTSTTSNTNSENNGSETPKRRRSPTLLKLNWLSERMRKVEKIKAALEAGTYRPDSTEVARALIGKHRDEDGMNELAHNIFDK